MEKISQFWLTSSKAISRQRIGAEKRSLNGEKRYFNANFRGRKTSQLGEKFL